MKTVYLLRHAKSDWTVEDESDHERVLNGRGRLAAPLIGRWLEVDQGAEIELALVSSAKRAQQTWNLISSELHNDPQTRVMEELYLCGPEAMLNIIRAQDDDLECLIVVAHNPDLQIICNLLGQAGDPLLRQSIVNGYPTAGLACLQFNVDRWSEITSVPGYLTSFVTPKDLE